MGGIIREMASSGDFVVPTLNGQPLNKPWFTHADIAGGGRLEFKMGSMPNKNWGSAPQDAPPSMSR